MRSSKTSKPGRSIGTRTIGLILAVSTAAYAGRGNYAATTDGRADNLEAVTTAPASVQPAPAPGPRGGVSVTDKRVTVGDGGLVEIHVNGENLLEVLRLLSLQTQKNIIASKDVNGVVTANLYNVTVSEALDAILQSSGFIYRERGNFIYVYTAKELATLERTTRVVSTRVFRLYYTPAEDALAMIKPVLSPDGSVVASKASGKGISSASSAGADTTSGSTDSGGNSYAGGDLLVVTDDANKLDQVQRLLAEIDQRPQEVLVEATILSATLSDQNSLGVDFTMLGGVKFDNLLQSASQTITQAAAGTLQNANGTGAQQYGIGNTNLTSTLPPGGLRVGYLSNSVSVFVQALEAVTNTTVLANPKVLSLDKQQGYFHVGRSDGYQTTTVSSTTSVQDVKFLDSGTTLAFRPFIGADGFIRMEIHPEDSNGGLTSSNLPFKTTTEVTANVMVQDGHTIVIGGLFRDSSSISRSQVPLLGDIPWLGALFRAQTDTTTRQEVIILLTPHIIKNESAYAKESAGEAKHGEDLRVGLRKGMMFFSRERLAEQAYENAVAELNKPNPDKNLALWHLNAATNLNPTFLEAIELKQKTSGRQLTDADNSSIRSFVSRSILTDEGPEPERTPPVQIGTRKSGDPAEPPVATGK